MALDKLDKDVVHEICTNQVVVTLHACVKEIVENALDAGAKRLELRLRESGSELLELIDDGHGIARENFEKLAMRHSTSKIKEYDDLSQKLATFGFRGEALSAISAMGDMTVCTRTAEDDTATLLSYDRFGKLVSQVPAAREVGTTISVRELFKRLPVRHREFMRNAKAQVSATLRLIQAYAIAQPEIRFHVLSEKVRGHGAGRATLMSSSGTAKGWKQAAAAILGDAALVDVEPFELVSEKCGWTVSGLISKPTGGRRSRDTQLFFCNRRPIDPPKRVIKLINDTFHQYSSRLWPVVILSFTASQNLVDVNVTPDKRTVFFHQEEELLKEVQAKLSTIYSPIASEPGSMNILSAIGVKPKSAQTSETIKCESREAKINAAFNFNFEDSQDASQSTQVVDYKVWDSVMTIELEDDSPQSMVQTPGLAAGSRQYEDTQTPEKVLGSSSSSNSAAACTSIDAPVVRDVPSKSVATPALASTSLREKDFQVVELTAPAADMSLSEVRFDDNMRDLKESSIDRSATSAPAAQYQVSRVLLPETPQDHTATSAPATQYQISHVVLPDVSQDNTATSAPVTQYEISHVVLPDVSQDNTASSAPATQYQVSHVLLGDDVNMSSNVSLDEPIITEYAIAPPPGSDDLTISEVSLDPQLGIKVEMMEPGNAVVPMAEGSILNSVPLEDLDDAPMVGALPPSKNNVATVHINVSMAQLEAGVARRNAARRPAGTSAGSGQKEAAPGMQFPSAFSLASLRPGAGKATLEQVATFGAGEVAENETDKRTDTSLIKFDKSCFSKMRVIGQFNLGFIIAALQTQTKRPDEDDKQDGHDSSRKSGLQLFIIDQHASDEKFRFEGLNVESRIDRQPLVNPHFLQLNPAQEQLAKSNLEVFRKNGFEIRCDDTRPPGRRLQLVTLPTCQGLIFGEKDIQDLLYTLEQAEMGQSDEFHTKESKQQNVGLLDLAGHRALWSSTCVPRPKKVWQLLACRACRSAIMIGKALRHHEMERILSNLGSLQHPWNCPHGRPTMRHLIDTSAAWQKQPRPTPLTALLSQGQY